MYLSATTDAIQAVQGAAATTTNCTYNVAYQDWTSSGLDFTTITGDSGSLNGTTDATIVPAPSGSNKRQVTEINIYNADTVPQIITVLRDISATNRILCKTQLAAGATLFWSKETGWTVLSSSSTPSYIVTEFTANGTWTKPNNIKWAEVVCVGAGGGGGGGMRGAAATNRFGGGGGGGGAIVHRLLNAIELASTVTVTIGTAGTGGAGQTVDSTNGNNGVAGGDTSFGSQVIAKGGSAGGGGTSLTGAAGAGGLSSTSTPVNGPYALAGGAGGTGQTTVTAPGATGLSGIAACPAGGGGMGINSSNTSGSGSCPGGGVYNNGSLVAGPASGVSATSNAAVTLFQSLSISSTNGLGTGGAGGIPTSTVAATNGGSYGAGGGGGYGQLNGTISGKGGDGAGGLCLVLEIY